MLSKVISFCELTVKQHATASSRNRLLMIFMILGFYFFLNDFFLAVGAVEVMMFMHSS